MPKKKFNGFVAYWCCCLASFCFLLDVSLSLSLFGTVSIQFDLEKENCVKMRQSASVRNFVRPACNTGRRRRSGQGVALTSISFLRRKYSKKFSVGSTRFTYLHCVDLLFSKIAYLMLPLMTLIVSQIGSNSIERLNFDFFWNLQLLLKGQGCRPIKLYLSWLNPEYRIV